MFGKLQCARHTKLLLRLRLNFLLPATFRCGSFERPLMHVVVVVVVVMVVAVDADADVAVVSK